MGCDIHIYKEKLVDGKWATADTWQCEKESDDQDGTFHYYTNDNSGLEDRNYSAFGILAGVRGDYLDSYKMDPKGLPEQMSEETERQYESWKLDAHGISYLSINELRNLQHIIENETIKITGFGTVSNIEKLNEQLDSGVDPDWDLIYPYTDYQQNDQFWAPFTYDVPIHTSVGDYVKRIIDALEGVGGDDQRIVFWFDN